MLTGCPPFLDSGIMACTSCRSGTIRASNASRLFISSSLDGSKDPTLTSDQSLGAATVPIHPDRVTRCEPEHAQRTWREEQTQRTIGHRAIELERIGKHTRPRSRICQKPDDERFDASASRMRSDKFPSSNGDMYPTITRKI